MNGKCVDRKKNGGERAGSDPNLGRGLCLCRHYRHFHHSRESSSHDRTGKRSLFLSFIAFPSLITNNLCVSFFIPVFPRQKEESFVRGSWESQRGSVYSLSNICIHACVMNWNLWWQCRAYGSGIHISDYDIWAKLYCKDLHSHKDCGNDVAVPFARSGPRPRPARSRRWTRTTAPSQAFVERAQIFGRRWRSRRVQTCRCITSHHCLILINN